LARVENKVVLLSGGASGIGAATARLVVREGGKAVLADRDEARGRALAEELGKSAMFVPLDVTDEPAWQKAVAASVETFGGLHGLLNAAGVGVVDYLVANKAIRPGDVTQASAGAFATGGMGRPNNAISSVDCTCEPYWIGASAIF